MQESYKRIEAAEAILAEAVSVVENPVVVSIVPQAGKLLSYLQEAGLEVFIPEIEGAAFGKVSEFPYFSRFSRETPDPNSVMLYPMYLQDASIGRIKHYTEVVEYASYGPVSHCITVNMDAQETLRLLACSFLHELAHAQAAHVEGRILKPQARSEQSRLYEEAAVWTLEYKLMLGLGGIEYVEAVDELIRLICECWQGIRPDISWQGKGEALNLCLGTSPSPNWRKERDMTFLAYCQLMAADIFFPEGKRMAVKMEIVKSGQTR